MILRLGVRFHRLFHRGPLLNEPCWVCSALWHRLLKDEQFNRDLAQGIEDMKAGRLVKWADVRRDL